MPKAIFSGILGGDPAEEPGAGGPGNPGGRRPQGWSRGTGPGVQAAQATGSSC
jgi:hypothetical protein